MREKEMETLKDIIDKNCIKFAGKTAFIEKNKDTKEFEEIKYSKLRQDVNALGTVMLKELNLKDQKIAVIGENSYKWFVTYMAVACGVGIIVPLDKELPANEIQNLIEISDATCVIYSSRKKEVIDKIKDKLPKTMIYIDMEKKESDDLGYSFDKLISKGIELVDANETEYIDAKINREEFKVLLFTSGTTAKSKGVMLSHKNLCFDVCSTCEVVPSVENELFFSILPMHHTYEFTITYLCSMYSGATVAIGEGLKYIPKNLNEIKPTIITVVPALIERMYAKIEKGINESGKKNVIEVIKIATNGLQKVGIDVKRKMFKQIHDNLGGNIKYIFCGAAPLDKDIMKNMQALGFNFIYGYGLTETSPLISGTTLENRAVGTVGKAITEVEIRIDLSKNEDENSNVGEIIVKGDNVFSGYYKNEEETKKVLRKGWFYTGDLGYFDLRGNLVISGRDKNVIVTSNGKNIFPEEIENLINKIPYVVESMVYAIKDPKKQNELIVSAKVTLDEDYLTLTYGDKRPTDKELHDLIWIEIKKINRTMVSYKAVKKLEIKKDEFVKTTTLKIKRNEELKKDIKN